MEIKSLWKVLEEYVNGALDVLPTLVFALAVLAAGFASSRVAERLARRVASRVTSDSNLKSLAATCARLAVLLVGIFASATVLFPGLEVGDLVGVLGLSSVAIGFAFKDIFQNFLAGVLILVRRPFRIDDQIKTTEYEGTVQDIDIRATTIRTFDGKHVIIPNSTVYTNGLVVYTKSETSRSTFAAGVGYGEDIERARRVMLDALGECEHVLPEPAPQAYVTGHGSSSIDFDVRYWHDSKAAEAAKARDEVATSIKYALDEAGIEIPYPYRTVEFFDRTNDAGSFAEEGEGAVVSPRRLTRRVSEEAAGE